MKNDLVNEITSVKVELLDALSRFSDQSLNIVPFEGSWTAGQAGEHVLLSVSAMSNALNGPVKPADRDPEQYNQLFSNLFLNFGHKLNSPDFIIPSDEPKYKQVLIKALEEKFNIIKHSAASGDLEAICTSFEMPTVGTLSKKEIIWFTIVHTKRHIHQLKHIAAVLGKPNLKESINN
jgi:hypothetical protein